MIVFDDVHISFGPLDVLKGISLEIASGSKTVIIGPSGSGKSTLLRTINMFERPKRGDVFIDGVSISSMTNRMLCQARQDIGMVFQNFNLYPHKTVLENLTLAPMVLKHESKTEARERAMKNLREVNIADRILFLDGGIILEDGTPDQVFHHPRNERTTLFLGKILH